MNNYKSNLLGIVLLWLALVVITYFSRYYFPLDETRYVTVAWNMWLRHDYLVPFLNGEAYSHKPPLLFWLINLGWAVFGINDWWPRLIPSFFALGSVLITQCIAHRLWPQHSKVASLAPVILLGSALWTVFTTAIMFDILLAFFTLLGISGLLVVWQDRHFKGWLLLVLAIAGGLLTKGPAILLQLLPVALLAPWWMTTSRPSWRSWYAGLFGSVLIGALVLLAWAIPAGIAGGAQYQHDIFWGQTADRMVHSFAHHQPVWWYLQVLPLILFPWFFAFPIWRALFKLRELPAESGIRFCLAWSLPVFIAFSLISGKQLHYLLPIFPAFALLAARAMERIATVSRLDKVVLLISGVMIGAALIYIAETKYLNHRAVWVEDISIWSGLALIAGTLALCIWRGNKVSAYLWRATLLSSLLVSVIYIGVIRLAGVAYDLRDISHHIKSLQDQGLPIACVGKYHGQFNFIGRLTHSPESLKEAELSAWFEKHPNGRAIVYFYSGRKLGQIKPEYLIPYRGGQSGILTWQQWEAWLKQVESAGGSDSEDDAAD